MMKMTDTKTVSTEKVAVRYLTPGTRLAMTGEKVVSVQGLTGWGRNRYTVTHRRLVLEREDGTQRVAEWNASTQVTIYA